VARSLALRGSSVSQAGRRDPLSREASGAESVTAWTLRPAPRPARCRRWPSVKTSAITAADVTREFEPDAPAVSQARRFLRQALQDLLGDGGAGDLADTLLMAANELATNAVLHARTEFTVRVAVDAVHVRVEVTDENSRVPQPCLAPADATSGRGLALIDGSGLHWGVDRHPGGKTVMAASTTLRLTGASALPRLHAWSSTARGGRQSIVSEHVPLVARRLPDMVAAVAAVGDRATPALREPRH
jgi:anti-sigma regulatory factor (Ser/Thr protein kinase)